MSFDSVSVTDWYVVKKGIRVYSSCSQCKHTNEMNRRSWMKGSYNIAHECSVCRKIFPMVQKKKNENKTFRT